MPPQIYYIYPQGNVMQASTDSPFLQIGESKYGKPISTRLHLQNAPGRCREVRHPLHGLDDEE
jgi:predicted proteasome-type protease